MISEIQYVLNTYDDSQFVLAVREMINPFGEVELIRNEKFNEWFAENNFTAEDMLTTDLTHTNKPFLVVEKCLSYIMGHTKQEILNDIPTILTDWDEEELEDLLQRIKEIKQNE